MRLEENVRMGKLEEEVELKTMIMKEKVENLTRKIETLKNTISQVEKNLEAQDSVFLQVSKNIGYLLVHAMSLFCLTACIFVFDIL